MVVDTTTTTTTMTRTRTRTRTTFSLVSTTTRTRRRTTRTRFLSLDVIVVVVVCCLTSYWWWWWCSLDELSFVSGFVLLHPASPPPPPPQQFSDDDDDHRHRHHRHRRRRRRCCYSHQNHNHHYRHCHNNNNDFLPLFLSARRQEPSFSLLDSSLSSSSSSSSNQTTGRTPTTTTTTPTILSNAAVHTPNASTTTATEAEKSWTRRAAAADAFTTPTTTPTNTTTTTTTTTILIHWKGEQTEGYSLELRHLEWQGAFRAVVESQLWGGSACSPRSRSSRRTTTTRVKFRYTNALDYHQEAEEEEENVDGTTTTTRSSSSSSGGSHQTNDNGSYYYNMPMHKRALFNQALQYVQIQIDDWPNDNHNDKSFGFVVWEDCLRQATERCSLIHATYSVVAQASTSYDDLCQQALQKGALIDLQPNQVNGNATWCVRVRQYGGGINGGGRRRRMVQSLPQQQQQEQEHQQQQQQQQQLQHHKKTRHGPHQTRSVSLERVALQALKPLLLTFGGSVDLQQPDCKIYVLDGIRGPPPPPPIITMPPWSDGWTTTITMTPQIVLARRLARGPRFLSRLAPKTRLCVTTTPLCPTAAYCLCNAAQIQPYYKVLDPYGGSATILLAAAQMEPTVQSISIEIAHHGYVNRHDIRRDFVTRNLPLPLALIHGDSTQAAIRHEARCILVQHEQRRQQQQQHQSDNDNDNETNNNNNNLGVFDCIITDPPYGIREASTSASGKTPIQELLAAIEYDRTVVGHRLLRKGGKLVCFLPCPRQQSPPRQRPAAAAAEESLEKENKKDHGAFQPLPQGSQPATRLDTTRNNNAAIMVPSPRMGGDDLDMEDWLLLSSHGVLPTQDEMDRAGLELVTMREQPLNDNLSRWLVVFDCIQ